MLALTIYISSSLVLGIVCLGLAGVSVKLYLDLRKLRHNKSPQDDVKVVCGLEHGRKYILIHKTVGRMGVYKFDSMNSIDGFIRGEPNFNESGEVHWSLWDSEGCTSRYLRSDLTIKEN